MISPRRESRVLRFRSAGSLMPGSMAYGMLRRNDGQLLLSVQYSCHKMGRHQPVGKYPATVNSGQGLGTKNNMSAK